MYNFHTLYFASRHAFGKFLLNFTTLILVLLRHRLSLYYNELFLFLSAADLVDVVKLTSLRNSSYFAPYSLLVRQSQAIFLGVKW